MRRALIGAVLALCASVQAAAAEMSLADVYAAMNPPVTPEAWHIHDPSRNVDLPGGGHMLAATGKAQEDGTALGGGIRH